MKTSAELSNARIDISALLLLVKTVLEDKPDAHPKIFKELAKYARSFAKNNNTPPEVLAKLAEDGEWQVKSYVAVNRNTPAKTLEKLAKDEDWKIRTDAAANPNTSSETLKKLGEDADHYVKCGVAHNPNTPPEVLAKLAKDCHSNVKCQVAHNPSTPPEVLIELAKDRDTVIDALNNTNMTFELCHALEGKVDGKFLRYRLHCLMLKDVFQSTYEFDAQGNIYLINDGRLKFLENIADTV